MGLARLDLPTTASVSLAAHSHGGRPRISAAFQAETSATRGALRKIWVAARPRSPSLGGSPTSSRREGEILSLLISRPSLPFASLAPRGLWTPPSCPGQKGQRPLSALGHPLLRCRCAAGADGAVADVARAAQGEADVGGGEGSVSSESVDPAAELVPVESGPSMSSRERRRIRNENRLQYLDPEAVRRRRESAEDMIMDRMVPKRTPPASSAPKKGRRKKDAEREGGEESSGETVDGGAGKEGAEVVGAVQGEEDGGHAKGGGRDERERLREGESEEGKEEGGEKGIQEKESAAASGAGPVIGDPIARLAGLGVRWWGVSVVSSMEFELQATIEALFTEGVPGSSLQVFVPYAPTTRSSVKTLDGKSAKRISPGAMYLRCVMTRSVYDSVREIEGLYGFVGTQEKHGRSKILVPWAIPDVEIERLKDVAQKQLEAQQEASSKRSQAARARREQASAAKKKKDQTGKNSLATAPGQSDPSENTAPDREGAQNANSAGRGSVRVGSVVRITKGPYMDLQGNALAVDKEQRMVKVGLKLLGRDVSIDVASDWLERCVSVKKDAEE